MSDRGKYESLIDESARRRFEQAWLAGQEEPIGAFLPSEEEASYLPTLEELVHIELEFAWSRYGSQIRESDSTDVTLLQVPLVESYLQRFPCLSVPAILARLLQQECRARCDAGRSASLDDYRHRFPDLLVSEGDLEASLERIIAERSAAPDLAAQLAETRGGSYGPLPSPSEAEGGRQFGGYLLLSELGRGGMGVVYRARQLSADRVVGLKVIRRDWLAAMPPEARASALDRFHHEAQAAARIEHEHIVRVYEVGAVEGEPFFSMQYVDGQSLAELIATGPLPGPRIASLLEPVARAVDEAHRRGILHRDLKPQNILVDHQSDSALVADFGLAKLLQTNDVLTCAGDVMGSPPYMSPEQARDSTLVTTQSDVYALGATLYHALIGKPPFQADTVLDTLAKVVHEEPVPLRQLDSSIALDLETICLKCLQKEPSRRYASAAMFADDLSCYLAGTPIAARPVGTLERCWLWCRRNPLIATLTVSTGVFLILTLIASVVGYFKTSAALETAERRHRETRQVINNYFTRVSKDRLLNEPGMQPLRKELLQDVLPYFHRFLDEFSDDTSIRDELALTHFRIGLITEEMDAPEDALPWYEAARAIQEEILVEQPDDQQCLGDLGSTLTAIGRMLQQQTKTAEAREVLQQAIEIRQRLTDLQPSQNEALRMLANSRMNLGLLEMNLGNASKANEQYERAQSIRRTILANDPHDVMTRRDLGMGSYNQAVLAVAIVGRDSTIEDPYAKAKQHFRRAATVFEELLEKDPRDLANQNRRVYCYRMLADLASVQRDYVAAEELYHQALEAMETLARRNPEVPDYQADLAGLFMNQGELKIERGDLDGAREGLERAESVLAQLVEQYGSVNRYRRDLAVTQLRTAKLLCESGQIPAARKRLLSARDHMQRLVTEEPGNDEFAARLVEIEDQLRSRPEAK